jgi:ubiquinone/menaquinone biosynthesis C-methylase UbiE
MGFYDNYILPRMMDAMTGSKDVSDERAKVLAEVKGSVLEIGFGSGHNLRFYPPAVEKVVGVDPSGPSAALAKTKERIAKAPFPVQLVQSPAEELAVPDASFDSVVTTLTLCTIGDPVVALRQMFRALKPGGRLFFLEHGMSADPGVLRWQNRLNGAQNYLFGGCNLNRDIERLVSNAGFQMEKLDKFYSPGPRPMACMYRGIARRAA